MNYLRQSGSVVAAMGGVDRCCAPATVWPAIVDTFLQRRQESVPFPLFFSFSFLGLLLSWRVPAMAGQFWGRGGAAGGLFLPSFNFFLVFN
jgi:hypothetical protein